ncbi:MAG: 2-enoyl thioester reductase domain-containing protein [Chlamydiota bacterium]|nr:2-enoyl thioester reductase domain-containing protein [Chlamydiota bacterium]
MVRINKVLCHYEYGSPKDVVRLIEQPIPQLKSDEVLIETQLAAVNPADINMLEGRYATKPELPCPLGYDGVGIVKEIGSSISSINIGDHVIVPSSRGAWCHYRIENEKDVIILPKNIPFEVAVMFNVNPYTALLMLEKFIALKEGDWIIQNAANSGVGRAVIDIAKRRGIKTVNIVRRKELIDELSDGDIVMTIEDLKAKKLMKLLPDTTMKLALNAVGGESARHIARPLSRGGFHVTYGAMGLEPIMIDNGLLIFKDITVKGFWRSEWIRTSSPDQLKNIYGKIASLAEDGAFVVPIAEIYPFEKASEAIVHAQKDKRGGKVLLTPHAF